MKDVVPQVCTTYHQTNRAKRKAGESNVSTYLIEGLERRIAMMEECGGQSQQAWVQNATMNVDYADGIWLSDGQALTNP